ncbi:MULTISPECIES: DUF397 domain-containing protein [unclassified Streptomyces]|uniref:DUF397 domain-containing protein n=1 Tax=unclassified Streptomyces TaxID=2593676 RepID=UPI00380E6A6A
MTLHHSAPQWQKSSYSNSTGGECVEVASLATDRVGVRDSKRPWGQPVAVRAGTWSGFVAALRRESI